MDEATWSGQIESSVYLTLTHAKGGAFFGSSLPSKLFKCPFSKHLSETITNKWKFKGQKKIYKLVVTGDFERYGTILPSIVGTEHDWLQLRNNGRAFGTFRGHSFRRFIIILEHLSRRYIRALEYSLNLVKIFALLPIYKLLCHKIQWKNWRQIRWQTSTSRKTEPHCYNKSA